MTKTSINPMAETVLVVENEDSAREALVDILEHRRYRVVDAKNGSEAVELISKHNVDLLLLDIKMDGPDGIDVAARVHQSAPDKPIVFVSAHTENEEYQRRTREAKINVAEWVQKPLKTEALIKVIERELHKRAHIKELMKSVNELGLNSNSFLSLLDKLQEVMQITDINYLREIIKHLMKSQSGKPPLASDINYQTYNKQKDVLLEKYGVGYVGYINGEFVGYDKDWDELIRKTYEKYNRIDIFSVELSKEEIIIDLVSPKSIRK